MKRDFGDATERLLAEALDRAGIAYVHESERPSIGLDFYLPDLDLYIEVKRFHSARISKQMSKHENVIVIQGINAVTKACQMIDKFARDKRTSKFMVLPGEIRDII